MAHNFRVQEKPFSKIQSGKKTIELRINDEKRQRLRIGEEIIFTHMHDPSRTLRVKVIDLYPRATFAELFQEFNLTDLGAQTPMDWVGLYRYYSKEQERRYGVLGIKIALLSPP